MLICDLHCDLPSYVLEGRKISFNEGHWSEDKLKKEHIYVQVFASCVDKLCADNPFERGVSLVDSFTLGLGDTELGIVTKRDQLEKNIARSKNSAILSLEGGEILGGKIENLKYFYSRGIRLMTLTWNNLNQIGGSCDQLCENKPLTDFGKKVVREMNRLKMTPDVSHLSEAGFWDVAEISGRPFCATHSNSKKLCDHQRNLNDKQFEAIRNSGGVVGVNYYPLFLEKNHETANILSIVRHIEHFMSLGGEETVCLGGDLDGIDILPKGLNGIGDVDKIAEELLKINYKEELVKKIMGENIIEFFKRVL